MQVKTHWRVLKFGGTSVASRNMWDNIVQIVQGHLMDDQLEHQQKMRILLVCSAPSGVSNHLENLIEAAVKNNFTQIFNQLRSQFEKLAQALELSATDETVQKAFDELWQTLVGVAALGEASPRIRAKIMAFGELTLTQIAHHFLVYRGLACRFLDARTVLNAETRLNTSMHDQFLNAHCSYQSDRALQKMLNQERLVITQGFIAANSLGETVLLGRGGSDTSAAYFAAKMDAECLEIWTDVPGVYTANPAVIPEARLISELSYLEAQELASMGAKIMHPRCIEPVAKKNIPLWIKYTPDPSRPGTKIHDSERMITGIKGVITKSGLVVLSVETLAMWHQAGFLADVFACFKKHGVSIDLISTSETMITVSLDQPHYAKSSKLLEPLLEDLRAIQQAKVSCLTPCASISIVGQAIRACLSEFADVCELFKEQRIYLLSQAANDLNLSLIVDEDQAPRLAAQIHRELIERRMQPAIFKATWREEFSSRQEETLWWANAKNELLALSNKTPCYVYSKKTIAEAALRLKTQIPSVHRWWYAMKANSHPEILRVLADCEFGFECVSLGELERVFATLPKLDPGRVLFTPNFAPLTEYQRAFELGVHVTCDNLALLRDCGEIFSGREVILRVDLGQGQGHHRYVVTGGDQSKFGMAIADLAQAADLASQYGIRIKGLHTHAGSGIRDAEHWGRVYHQLSTQAALFPELAWLNLGGGLGVSDYPGGEILDLTALEENLALAIATAASEPVSYQIWMEPGRYLVAEAGVLLTQVTQIKTKNEQQFIGVDTGMNSLIRPMLYGAYHHMVNLTRFDTGAQGSTQVTTQVSTQPVHVVGPICESGDVLGYNRSLGPTQHADIILISHAGAYGRSMSSCYNLREPASEFFLSN